MKINMRKMGKARLKPGAAVGFLCFFSVCFFLFFSIKPELDTREYCKLTCKLVFLRDLDSGFFSISGYILLAPLSHIIFPNHKR